MSPLVLIAVLLGRHRLMRRRPPSLWGITALAAVIFVLECLSLDLPTRAKEQLLARAEEWEFEPPKGSNP